MNKMKELENQISELKNKLTDAEKGNKELNDKLMKELLPFKGEIQAKVKNNLLIRAQIKLKSKRASLDTARSKNNWTRSI